MRACGPGFVNTNGCWGKQEAGRLGKRRQGEKSRGSRRVPRSKEVFSATPAVQGQKKWEDIKGRGQARRSDFVIKKVSHRGVNFRTWPKWKGLGNVYVTGIVRTKGSKEGYTNSCRVEGVGPVSVTRGKGIVRP